MSSVTYREEMKKKTILLMYWEKQDFEQNDAQITRGRQDSVVTCVCFVFQIG